jgi:hypothetical protein
MNERKEPKVMVRKEYKREKKPKFRFIISFPLRYTYKKRKKDWLPTLEKPTSAFIER